jgi:hypothetical protein
MARKEVWVVLRFRSFGGAWRQRRLRLPRNTATGSVYAEVLVNDEVEALLTDGAVEP